MISLSKKQWSIIILSIIFLHISIGKNPPPALPDSFFDSVQIDKLNHQAYTELTYGNLNMAKRHAEKALQLADETNYLRGQATAIEHLGTIYMKNKKYEEAFTFYYNANTLWKLIGSKISEVSNLEKTAFLYMSLNSYKRAADYYQEAYEIVKTLDEPAIQGNIEESLASIYKKLGEYEKAATYYRLAIQSRQRLHMMAEVGQLYRQLHQMQSLAGNHDHAIEAGNKALDIFTQLKDTSQISDVLTDIGHSLTSLKEHDKAEVYFERALELQANILKKAHKKEEKIARFIRMGEIAHKAQKYKKARQHYESAYNLIGEEGDCSLLVDLCNKLAYNEFVAKHKDDALSYAGEAFTIGQECNKVSREAKMETYLLLSEIYNMRNAYKRSQEWYAFYNHNKNIMEKEANQLHEELLAFELKLEKQEKEFKLEAMNRQNEELKYQQVKLENDKKQQELILREQELAILRKNQELQAIALEKQKLEEQRAKRELLLIKQRIEAEEKDKQLALLEKDRAMKALELEKQKVRERLREDSLRILQSESIMKEELLKEEQRTKTFSYAIIGLLTGFLVFAFVAYRKIRKSEKELKVQSAVIQEKNEELTHTNQILSQTALELKESRKELQRKNDALTSSITYAQRIQRVIMPTETELSSIFPESFVLFLPRDIVSGDFYWLKKRRERIYIAVADCTGHGVPGAFMSLIGIEKLEQAVDYVNISSPNLILNYLNKSVKNLLQQRNSELRDGMDIAICTIDLKKKILDFSGARADILVFQNNEMQVLKGDRNSIAGRETIDEFYFTKYSLKLDKPTTVYMFTDGYRDQFGGELNTKIGSVKFKELIQKVSVLSSFAQQKEELERFFREWKGKEKQLDDVTVLSFKINDLIDSTI
ncbi:MAG: SpoIIE family protein phosphatase [Cytophagales bacterium]|nr:SpoIIE family protein phosphatase [Cytophagales bacterium]MDW8384518.1 SpoIIE family protein phosphatase [Flammeovirgaceae bacterium]